MKLIGKIIISGIIEAVTGLHIGGSKSALDIGGVDLNIIKTPTGEPFIPGSSLKGKLRALLGRESGKEKVEEDEQYVKEMFGHSDKDPNKAYFTRLLVRDASLRNGKSDLFVKSSMEFPYSDVKWENRINRKTGTATDPRQLERVPAGAQFDFEMVYDLYDDALPSTGELRSKLAEHFDALELAMRLLQDDYLGGQGSRGYGQVVFKNTALSVKKINNGVYEPVKTIEEKEITDFQTKLAQLHTHASRPVEV